MEQLSILSSPSGSAIEMIMRLQEQVDIIAKAQGTFVMQEELEETTSTLATKAELAVVSDIDVALVPWLQESVDTVRATPTLKRYFDAVRITLRACFSNVAMQDAGLDGNLLHEDSMLVSGMGTLLTTIGQEIPGIRTVLSGVSTAVGVIRNHSQDFLCKTIMGAY